jgi:hypothetical protein
MDTDDALKRIRERIHALRAKTVERGCTEQEALAAANKVSSLLERYGMTLSETDLLHHMCQKVVLSTGRRRGAPWDACILVIADFCECRVWKERCVKRMLQIVFFGFPADVEAARYLYDLIVLAFRTETLTFKLGVLYKNMAHAGKRRAIASFQIGLSSGISEKFHLLKAERDSRLKSSGSDLTLLKISVVQEEFKKLGLYLQKKRAGNRKKIMSHAYEAGHKAGARFEKAITAKKTHKKEPWSPFLWGSV